MTKPKSKQLPDNQPLVSICVPTYNAERTVVATLQSILNQTYHNLEILVVDNASTDNTLSLLQQINDPRLVIHRNERNIGAEQNWSKCVHLAAGEYIAIFHADDLYLPDMAEKQVRVFQDSPAIGAVFTLAKYINNRGEVIGKSKLPSELRGKGIYCLPEIFLSILRNGNFLFCPSCMMRGKLYKQLAPFNYDRFRTSADLDMWLRVLEKHPIAILGEELMCYRMSDVSWSYQSRYVRTEEADFFKVMDYHLSVKSSVLNIPHTALDKYEFQRNLDKITRAVNYLIKAQPEEAKRLLKQSLSTTIFRIGVHRVKPKLLAYWVFGVILLGSAHLGLGRYLAKSLRWLLRWRERRFV
ncbi:MAG: putative glycosyltransferase EpsE [Dehalococcoidia bacterium]|nr:putative glycosyltransferase EpsE [Bacillota bacterium]